MGAAPFDIPVVDWPSSPEARKWIMLEFLPFVGPPLILALLLPLLLFCVWCRSRKGWLSHSVGIGLAGVFTVAAILFLALVFYLALLLLNTATALEGAALNVTQEASLFTCAPAGGPPPPPAAASFTCAGAPTPHAATDMCDASSLIGFARGLADGTVGAAGEAVSFIGNLSAAAESLTPLLASSAATSDLASALAGNVSALNATIETLQRALHTAYHLAAPYFPNSPDAWGPLAASSQYEVPPIPPSSIAQTADLAASLQQQHLDLASSVASAQSAAKAQTAGVVTHLSRVNATVYAEAQSLSGAFEEAKGKVDTLCGEVDHAWRSVGLPRGDVTNSVQHLPTYPMSPSNLGSPAIEIMLAVAGVLLLPALLLLSATYGATKGCGFSTGSSCGTLAVLTLPLLLLISAVCLGISPLLGALCEPGAIDTVLRVNLAPLGNITLPTPPPLTPGGGGGGGGAPSPPMGTDSIAIAQLVPEVLACGTRGHASNLIELLHLESVVSFAAPLAELTKSLDGELAAFGTAAVAPIDAALALLPQAESVLESVSTFSPPGLDAALNDLRNMTSTMAAILPAAVEPGVFDPARLAWVELFAALYGTPLLGPDAQMIAVNKRLLDTLADAASMTAPIATLVDACNASAASAPHAFSDVEHALLGARSVCESTATRGHELDKVLSTVIDDVARAEDVTPCGWVSRSYTRAKDLTCDVGYAQIVMLGFLMGGAAIALALGVCVLTCTRPPQTLVALELRGRGPSVAGGYSARPTRDTSASQGGMMRPGEEPLVLPREPSIVLERESPFAYYSAQRRLSKSAAAAAAGSGLQPSSLSYRDSNPPSERRESQSRPEAQRVLFGRSSRSESTNEQTYSAPLPPLAPPRYNLYPDPIYGEPSSGSTTDIHMGGTSSGSSGGGGAGASSSSNSAGTSSMSGALPSVGGSGSTHSAPLLERSAAAAAAAAGYYDDPPGRGARSPSSLGRDSESSTSSARGRTSPKVGRFIARKLGFGGRKQPENKDRYGDSAGV